VVWWMKKNVFDCGFSFTFTGIEVTDE